MKQKKKQADDVGAFLNVWRQTESNGKVNGLRGYHKASSCIVRACCAIIYLTRSITGLGFSSLNFTRRTIAMPSCGVFSCAVVLFHGVIASILRMGAPCGKPSGLLCPCEQSANPHGAVHPFSRGLDGNQNPSQGVQAMSSILFGASFRAPISLKQSTIRKASSCAVCVRSAMLDKSLLTGGQGFDRLKHNHRRTTATPFCGVFFGRVVQTHGTFAPAFCMGAPCGKPSGLPSPVIRSVNPYGASHHLTEAGGDTKTITGSIAMFNRIVERLRAPIPFVFSSVEA